MRNKKLKTRQRTHLSTRMKWIIGASVFGGATFILIIYFNFFDVSDSRAFSSGDYRTIESGDWNESHVWEVFDGDAWQPASMPPGTAAGKVVVTAGNYLTISEEIPLCQLEVDSGAVVGLEANTIRVAKSGGSGGIICKGKLILNTCIIEGDGDFMTGPNARLMIGSDAGISRKGGEGNIQLRGKREIHKNTHFIYNGTIRQKTGNGLPPVVTNLEIDNSSGVELDGPVQITGCLTLKAGVLFTGKHLLELGTSATAVGKMEIGEGAVSGKWNYWYNLDDDQMLIFPLSDGSETRKFAFKPAFNQYKKGMITLTSKEGIPDDASRSPFEARMVIIGITETGHFGAMFSHGSEDAWLTLQPVKANDQTTYWNICGKETGDSKSVNGRTFQNLIAGPEPFSHTLVIRFYSEEPSFAVIQLSALNGTSILKETVQAEPGYNQYEFEIKPEIKNGSYTLQISNMNDIKTCKVSKVTPDAITQVR